MRRVLLISFTSLFFLTACNSVQKPSDINFRKAIDQYLAKHGKACEWIGQSFPIDVSESDLEYQSGSGAQMAVLEAAGLVRSSETVAVTPVILGRGIPHRVKRYEPTDAGRKYLEQAPGTFGQTAGFCYGAKTVDSIVKWTEPAPMGTSSQTEVTYTYKIANLAPWAERPAVQREFGDVLTTVNGISKSNEIAGLQLTNKGWDVSEP